MTALESDLEGSAFSRFMASGGGRATRVALGVALVGVGAFVIPPPAGIIVAAAGLVPIAAGVFNWCPIAPMWGGHFRGAAYCKPRNS